MCSTLGNTFAIIQIIIEKYISTDGKIFFTIKFLIQVSL